MLSPDHALPKNKHGNGDDASYHINILPRRFGMPTLSGLASPARLFSTNQSQLVLLADANSLLNSQFNFCLE